MKKVWINWIIGLIFVFGFSAIISRCKSDEITEKNIRARSANAGQNSAVYFEIDNLSMQDDILLEVRSDIAESVEIHLSKIDENSVVSMVKQENVPVPARSAIEFKPGGLHVMLISLKNDMQIGDSFDITLVFQNAGEITLKVPVQEK